MGAMYHPEGEKDRYERSRLEPLDREGRGELARFDEGGSRAGQPGPKGALEAKCKRM